MVVVAAVLRVLPLLEVVVEGLVVVAVRGLSAHRPCRRSVCCGHRLQ